MEVAIVGGGIAGLTTAVLLQRAGRRAAVPLRRGGRTAGGRFQRGTGMALGILGA